jgi:membrane-associated phospholipid phosphatase
MPSAPPDLNSEEFTTTFNHVKEIGSADSTTRTDDQTQIALFWADGARTATPPGHWNRIAATVARDQRNTLYENSRLFALLNIALADAGLVSWDAKYYYNFCRPITAIQNANSDNNPATTADADWSPLLTTPPFPSYTSGHSTFSAAAATVLAGFFGTDKITFTSTAETPGASSDLAPRTFKSFSAAASEAGLSRIYGGIHWSFDNTAALTVGKRLGQYVFNHMLQSEPEVPPPSEALPAFLLPGRY